MKRIVVMLMSMSILIVFSRCTPFLEEERFLEHPFEEVTFIELPGETEIAHMIWDRGSEQSFFVLYQELGNEYLDSLRMDYWNGENLLEGGLTGDGYRVETVMAADKEHQFVFIVNTEEEDGWHEYILFYTLSEKGGELEYSRKSEREVLMDDFPTFAATGPFDPSAYCYRDGRVYFSYGYDTEYIYDCSYKVTENAIEDPRETFDTFAAVGPIVTEYFQPVTDAETFFADSGLDIRQLVYQPGSKVSTYLASQSTTFDEKETVFSLVYDGKKVRGKHVEAWEDYSEDSDNQFVVSNTGELIGERRMVDEEGNTFDSITIYTNTMDELITLELSDPWEWEYRGTMEKDGEEGIYLSKFVESGTGIGYAVYFLPFSYIRGGG